MVGKEKGEVSSTHAQVKPCLLGREHYS
jgi:hypothetical protein